MTKFNDTYVVFVLDKKEVIIQSIMPIFSDDREEAVDEMIKKKGGLTGGIQVYKLERVIGRIG